MNSMPIMMSIIAMLTFLTFIDSINAKYSSIMEATTSMLAGDPSDGAHISLCVSPRAPHASWYNPSYVLNRVRPIGRQYAGPQTQPVLYPDSRVTRSEEH